MGELSKEALRTEMQRTLKGRNRSWYEARASQLCEGLAALWRSQGAFDGSRTRDQPPANLHRPADDQSSRQSSWNVPWNDGPAVLGLVPTFAGEPLIDSFLTQAAAAGLLYLPRTTAGGGALHFLAVPAPWEKALVSGPGKTREPAGGPEFSFDPRRGAVVLVPGLAFDRRGHRLGRGWGCYDRFLATLDSCALRVGVAWSFQVVAEVPRDSWDQPVDVVVTEEATMNVSDRGGGRPV